MKYIKRRVGENYEVIDSVGSVDGIYSLQELKTLLDSGIDIKGVFYV